MKGSRSDSAWKRSICLCSLLFFSNSPNHTFTFTFLFHITEVLSSAPHRTVEMWSCFLVTHTALQHCTQTKVFGIVLSCCYIFNSALCQGAVAWQGGAPLHLAGKKNECCWMSVCMFLFDIFVLYCRSHARRLWNVLRNSVALWTLLWTMLWNEVNRPFCYCQFIIKLDKYYQQYQHLNNKMISLVNSWRLNGRIHVCWCWTFESIQFEHTIIQNTLKWGGC